jgi:hypothetical protein
MAASGYATESDVESIWDDTFDTTRFDKLNKHIGRKFNFWITGETGTDITDTDITEILAAETTDLILYYYSIAKERKVADPWDFINIAISKLAMGDNFKRYFRGVIEICRKKLGETEVVEFHTVGGLGSTNDI